MSAARSTATFAVAVLALAVLTWACGDDGGGLALDGSPRRPDAEGVLVAVADDLSTLTLDGDRTYEVDEGFRSFASATASATPLRARVGQYVQVRLNGDRATWLAAIGAVVDLGSVRVAYHAGEAVEADDEVVFADGTVLAVLPGVEVPTDVPVTVEIDVEQRAVRALV